MSAPKEKPTPETSRPRLIWDRPDGSQEMFPLLTSPMTVGRAESADICVDEALVSKLHARIDSLEASMKKGPHFIRGGERPAVGAATKGRSGKKLKPR